MFAVVNKKGFRKTFAKVRNNRYETEMKSVIAIYSVETSIWHEEALESHKQVILFLNPEGTQPLLFVMIVGL